jgi:hypothetical protein
VQSLVQDTHRRSKSNSDKNPQASPVLVRVPSELFGVCVVGTSGRIYGVGDVDYEFSIMSVSKRNATGLPFSSLAKIAANSFLPKEIQTQVDPGGITCVSNHRLQSSMERTTVKPQAMSQGQRPEMDLISLARHVPIHGESKKTLTKGESQWMQSIAAARCVVFYVWPSPRVLARVRSPTQSRPCRSPWKKASGTRLTILKSRFKPSPAVRRGGPAVRRPAPFPVRAIVGTVVGSAGGTGAVGCVAGGGNGYAQPKHPNFQ